MKNKSLQTNCESIIITGDIAEVPSLENILKKMANEFFNIL